MYVSTALILYDPHSLYVRDHWLIAYIADQIDKHSLEIAQADDETYTNVQELGDELPDHSPRYILLSYPLLLVNWPRRLIRLSP